MSRSPGESRSLAAGAVLVACCILSMAAACGSLGTGGGEGLNLLSVEQEWAMRDDLRRQMREIERNAVLRVDGPAHRTDTRPRQLTILDSRSDRECIREIRTGIERSRDTVTRQHGLHGRP